MKKQLGIAAMSAALCFAAACGEPTDSASSALTVPPVPGVVFLPNAPGSNGLIPGSVSTQITTVNGGPCGTNQQNQIVSAFEYRDNAGGGIGNSSAWAVACTSTAGPPVLPTIVTTANAGGIPNQAAPYAWPAMPMAWVGEPQLVTLGPDGLIALIGLVTSSGIASSQTAQNIAIVVSTNGGLSWGPLGGCGAHACANLVAPADGTHAGPGGSIVITDYAATPAAWNGSSGNQTIFIVWSVGTGSSPTASFTTAVTFDSHGNWLAPSSVFTPANVPPWAMSTSMGGIIVSEMGLTSGIDPFGNQVLYMAAPTITSLTPSHCPSSFGTTTQQWTGFASWGDPTFALGRSWTSEPLQTENNWPRCVGGIHDNFTSIYPNIARPSLAFNSTGMFPGPVIATTHVRTNGSVQVHLNERSWHHCSPCGPHQKGSGVTVSTVDSSPDTQDSNPLEDQFEPFIAGDNAGNGVIGWYDTADGNFGRTDNEVYAVHGQVQPWSAGSLSANFYLYNGGYKFQHDLGRYNGAGSFWPQRNLPNNFGTGFVDGYNNLGAPNPNGQGGLWTEIAQP